MTDPNSTWKDEASLVGQLSATMLYRLEQHRLDKKHWQATSTHDLQASLQRTFLEFQEYHSWENAADLANYAAMLAVVLEEK